MKIKSGDVVTLKSGSPTMTVGSIDHVDNVATVHYFAQNIEGDWMYEGHYHIHVNALVKVKKEKQ